MDQLNRFSPQTTTECCCCIWAWRRPEATDQTLLNTSPFFPFWRRRYQKYVFAPGLWSASSRRLSQRPAETEWGWKTSVQLVLLSSVKQPDVKRCWKPCAESKGLKLDQVKKIVQLLVPLCRWALKRNRIFSELHKLLMSNEDVAGLAVMEWSMIATMAMIHSWLDTHEEIRFECYFRTPQVKLWTNSKQTRVLLDEDPWFLVGLLFNRCSRLDKVFISVRTAKLKKTFDRTTPLHAHASQKSSILLCAILSG